MRFKILIGGLNCLFLFSCNKTPTTPDIPEKNLPIISFFSASPAEILLGNSSVLSWSVSNAITIEINQGIGIVSATGSVNVKPRSTTTYTLTATSNDGKKQKLVK